MIAHFSDFCAEISSRSLAVVLFDATPFSAGAAASSFSLVGSNLNFLTFSYSSRICKLLSQGHHSIGLCGVMTFQLGFTFFIALPCERMPQHYCRIQCLPFRDLPCRQASAFGSQCLLRSSVHSCSSQKTCQKYASGKAGQRFWQSSPLRADLHLRLPCWPPTSISRCPWRRHPLACEVAERLKYEKILGYQTKSLRNEV